MKFAVTIRATVTKTLEIEADNSQDTVNAAHEQFSILAQDGEQEKYTEDTLKIEEIKE